LRTGRKGVSLNPEEAREVLKQTMLHVDLVNLGRTISALGEYGYTWKTFDNSKWRPNKNLALKESRWLKDNASNIFEALTEIQREKNESNNI
jgi:hypothetical protein